MTVRKLHLGRGVALPLDYVTKTAAVIAKRRVGKTYTGGVLAEEMCAVGIPWYALDPTEAWWGLRSSADGKKPGLPVVVLGGSHGDVPIGEHDGKAIADLIVDEPSFYVIDLSMIDESHAATIRFVTAFLDRLYRRKAHAKDPLHGFWDEADMFAPQKPGPDQTRMLGAAESIVRRGGIRGLGTTLFTQRAAVLNKNVLTQLDILVMLRTVSPQDQAAVDEYVKANATPEQRREVMGSLASLGLGEAWVYGPGEEPELLQRVQIRERRTFNSSATPKAGERRIEPTKLADVDLDALRARFAAQVEKAKAEDPKLLQQRIKAQDRQIAELSRLVDEQQLRVPETVEVEVERQVVPEGLHGSLASIQTALVNAIELLDRARGIATSERARVQDLEGSARSHQTARSASATAVPTGGATATRTGSQPDRARGNGHPSRQGAAPAPVPAAQNNGNGPALGKAERRVLSVLAQFPQGRSMQQIAILTEYSVKSGGLRNALGALRSAGLVDRNQPIGITPEGLAAIDGQYEPLPSGDALFDHWLAKMGKAERAILTVLRERAPLSMDELADRTGYSVTSGGLRNALGKLRTLELVEPRQPVDLTAEFVEAIA